MASPNEAGPSENQNQIDEPANVHQINALFPRIDNLQHFPINVLINIFENCDDIALLNLTEIDSRFDGIAKTVFRDRYLSDYFVIEGESTEQRAMHLAILEHFARHADIRAIAAKSIMNIDANHWMAQLIRRYTNHLEKLSFDECSFRNCHGFLSQYMNITHLSLQHIHYLHNSRIQLPEFRNLKKLELSRVTSDIPFETLARIISANPTLESFILRHSNFLQINELIGIIAINLMNLKELTLIAKNCILFRSTALPYSTMDRFANTIQHTESLGLTMENHISNELVQSIELLKRVGRACKNLKHLELKVPTFHEIRTELVANISRFEKLESFALEIPSYDNDAVESMLGQLPNLRRLYIKFDEPNSYVNNLVWLQRYPLIEHITLAIDNFNFSEADSSFIGDLEYFMELHAIMQNQRVRIEFEENSQIIGRITEDEIVWRNKLMHRKGCGANSNQTNLRLLQMADVIPLGSLPNPFDLILDYLDLRSLNALAMTCNQSMRLIDRYAQRRSQRQVSFTISNEFSYDNEPPQSFARHVNNLNVYNFDWNGSSLTFIDFIKRNYRNVIKLCIMYDRLEHQSVWLSPEVRHFTCISLNSYSGLIEIYNICPNLEILECKEEIRTQWHYESVRFPNLRKFVFKYSDDEILAMVQRHFQNTNVELVPIA